MEHSAVERRIVKTISPVYGGYAFAREEGLGVVFVRWALPGETVEVRIGQRKKGYAFAEAINVLDPSPYRVAPPCEVFGRCGGCQLQHASYSFQLEMKRWILEEAFRRIAKRDVVPAVAPPGDPFDYRFRGQFKTDGDAVGFFAERSRRLVAVSRCPLMVAPINGALPGLCGLGAVTPGLSEIHLASDGERAVAWLPGARLGDEVVERLAGRLSGACFEDGTWGEERVTLSLEGLTYAVSPRSFFQANWRMNRTLVRRILDFFDETPHGRLLDLYAGAGNFALPLASRFAEVVAVEGEPRAFSDLRSNIARNRIGNIRAVRSTVEAYRPQGRYDVLVVDPPRSGLSAKALSIARSLGARAICYVSCNPSTLARDVAAFSDRYDLRLLQMYDFFPNTHHVETLAVLLLR
ncbi:MAG: class I SAM-dependent RNA methyltransferase [Verrucomicrobiota bacterium]